MEGAAVIQALRWGRSAYETELGLQEEALALRRLGVELGFSVEPVPDVSTVVVLVVTSGVRVDEALLERAPELRLVVTTTSGTDHIDVSAARKRGSWLLGARSLDAMRLSTPPWPWLFLSFDASRASSGAQKRESGRAVRCPHSHRCE